MGNAADRFSRKNYGSGYDSYDQGRIPSTDTYSGYDDFIGYGGRSNDSSNSRGRDSSAPSPRRRRKSGHVGRKILLVFIILLVALVVAIGMFCAKIDANLHGFGDPEQSEVSAALSGNGAWGIGAVNVLLLGSDARPDDPGMGARTDAIVIARVDAMGKKVSMVSIPRDTMVDIPGYGTNKINAAYAYGGASGAVEAVENLCGIKIDHCVVVDFNGLAAMVDAVGGIDVFLEEGIDDPLAGDVTIPAGASRINGAQALALSRSRAWADGDYTRQLNQRKVISGLANRLMALPVTEMPGAIEGCSACVAADTGTGCLGLLLAAVELKLPGGELSIQNAHIPSDVAMVDGVSYVIADTAGTAELMARLENRLDIEAPLSASSIEADIANAYSY